MAAHTKIVDFFGLPGSGKSTLVNCLKEKYGEGARVATIDDIVDDIKKENIWTRMTSISPVTLLYAILFRFAVPFDENRKDRSFKNWVKHGILYNYAKKFSSYDIVLVDEGNIQNFVKFERGDDLHERPYFVNACKQYIHTSPVSLYVYCGVDVEIANNRIVKRNRGVGRIDVIKDDETRKKELEREKRRFVFFSSLLTMNGLDCIDLEMNSPPERIAEKLFQRLNG